MEPHWSNGSTYLFDSTDRPDVVLTLKRINVLCISQNAFPLPLQRLYLSSIRSHSTATGMYHVIHEQKKILNASSLQRPLQKGRTFLCLGEICETVKTSEGQSQTLEQSGAKKLNEIFVNQTLDNVLQLPCNK